MGSTRDKSGREVMGWLEGGYQTLIDALEQRIVALGGEVRAGATVESIEAEGGRAVGVVVDGRLRRFDSRALHARAADGAPRCSHPSSPSALRPTTAATSASSACCSGRRAASARTTT